MERLSSVAQFHTFDFDLNLNLIRFHSKEADWLGLTSSDVGNGLEQLAERLAIPKLVEVAKSALSAGTVCEQEGTDSKGGQYLIHAQPAFGPGDEFDGVSVSLLDVTRIHTAHVDRLRLQDAYRLLLETSIDGIYGVDAAGIVTFINPAASRMLGYQDHELIGSDWAMMVQPDAGVDDELATGHTGGRLPDAGPSAVDDDSTLFCRKDGSRFPVEVRVTPALDRQGEFNGHVGIFHDLSERLRVQREAHETKTRSEMAFKAGQICVWEWDPSSRQYASARGYGELLGFEAGVYRYQDDPLDFTARLHPEDRDHVGDSIGLHVTGQADYDVEFRLLCKNGEYRWFRACGDSQRDQNGLSIRMIGMLEDITRRKEAELRLLQQIRNRDNFLAMLSHELRNPMGALTNAVAAIELEQPTGHQCSPRRDGDRSSSDLEDGLQVIQTQCRHMSRLLEDLLDVSRMTHNKIQYERTTFDLRENGEEAIRTVQHLFANKQQALEQVVSEAPIFVFGDPNRIRQVQVNLLSNASRFTKHQGCVRLELAVDGNDALIRIRDTGIGIERDAATRIFDMFYQGQTTLDRADGGMGIGLSLAKQIVNHHGGTISAHSDGRGKGSTFEIRLPTVQPSMATKPTRIDHHLEGTNVLLVDDGVDARRMLARLLELHGLNVDQAADGETAVERILDRAPDVAVVDIGLPKMNGYQVAEVIRASHPQPILLIALTGYGHQEDKNRSREAGFDAHLVKPLDPQRLLALIDADREKSSVA